MSKRTQPAEIRRAFLWPVALVILNGQQFASNRVRIQQQVVWVPNPHVTAILYFETSVSKIRVIKNQLLRKDWRNITQINTRLLWQNAPLLLLQKKRYLNKVYYHNGAHKMTNFFIYSKRLPLASKKKNGTKLCIYSKRPSYLKKSSYYHKKPIIWLRFCIYSKRPPPSLHSCLIMKKKQIR